MAGKFTLYIDAKLNDAKIKTQLKELSSKSKITVDSKGMGKLHSQTVKAVDANGKLYTVQKKVNKEGKLLTTSVTQSSKVMKSWGGEMLGVIGKVAKFGLATAAIGAVTTAFYSGIQAVKEYDSALTEFKKVSDLSGSSLDAYAEKLGKAGTAYGRTRTEMVQAATEAKKGGYTDSESAQLAEVAVLYQNIADSEMTAGDSMTFIISQMKAFNIPASEATSIIDKVNEVSNRMAVSSTDVGLALTKTSSAMSTLGNDANETIGLVAAGVELMPKQAGKVSRGLNF